MTVSTVVELELSLLPSNRGVTPPDVNQIIMALTGKTRAQMTPQPWDLQAGASTSLSLSTSPADIPDATVTLPYVGRYLILAAWDLNVTVVNGIEGIAYGRLVSATYGNLTPDVVNEIYPQFTANSVLSGGSPGESVATTVEGSLTSQKTISQYFILETAVENDVLKLQAYMSEFAFTGIAGDNCCLYAMYLGPTYAGGTGIGGGGTGGGGGGVTDHGGLGGLTDDDHTQYIKHALATAASDFLVASGVGAFVKKTLAEVKTILGLGSAAYTASTDYATAAKGVTNGDSHDHVGGDGAQIDHGGLAGLADDDHTQYIKHSLATAVSDFLCASGAGVFVKKTLAEVKTILGLGSAAYTASTDYAVAAKGVTNGDSHDHNGGDGGSIAVSSLTGIQGYVVYTLYNRLHAVITHANPNTTYIIFQPAGYDMLQGLVDHGTIAFTHARLIISCVGNEAGEKGLKVTVNGTAIEILWSGVVATNRDSGWVSITSPGGIAEAILYVKGSSSTEDIGVYSAYLFFKREV